MAFKFTREFYIPKDAKKLDVASDADIYVYTTTSGKLCGMAFHGKCVKPAWHYSFSTEEKLARQIRDYLESRAAHAAYKAEQRAIAKQPHTLKVGAVLRTCWGYDQTNVEFFQVVRVVSDRTVEVQEMKQSYEATGSMQGYTMPDPETFGPVLRRRADRNNSVKIDSCRRASEWNGNHCYTSSYA